MTEIIFISSLNFGQNLSSHLPHGGRGGNTARGCEI